ncbi:hypothetical protein MTX78_15245 [Hymenobacter tibetensis]|uniref:DUF2256 domain-containing protein n=1 Tax=Hymenobacter tibetensis TaxID=497967 RepID=A0ABY4CTA1_9BACT|nr:hypothetical protein [Hymenobacter tibetensis]UOG73480.1 hypothetical protein MTX78_15245 [Hymenobacter tibetensis]
MPTSEKQCAVCETWFSGRADKIYCSVACRVWAHRHQQEQQNEEASLFTDIDLLPWQMPIPVSPPSSTALTVVARDEDDDPEEDDFHTKWRKQQALRDAQEQQRKDQALAREVHRYYMKAIEALLHWEGQHLKADQLSQLWAMAIDCLEDYKEHPYLGQPNSIARQRINDLRDAAKVFADTMQEARTKWLTGHMGRYELTKKWKKQLYDRLLE